MVGVYRAKHEYQCSKCNKKILVGEIYKRNDAYAIAGIRNKVYHYRYCKNCMHNLKKNESVYRSTLLDSLVTGPIFFDEFKDNSHKFYSGIMIQYKKLRQLAYPIYCFKYRGRGRGRGRNHCSNIKPFTIFFFEDDAAAACQRIADRTNGNRVQWRECLAPVLGKVNGGRPKTLYYQTQDWRKYREIPELGGN